MQKYANMREVYNAVAAKGDDYRREGVRGSASEGFAFARGIVIDAERADGTVDLMACYYAMQAKAEDFRAARKRNGVNALMHSASIVLHFVTKEA
jgi:hypothetical protein